MSTNTIRKNITLPSATYEMINSYAKKSGKSFSEFLRDTALQAIAKHDSLSLLEYMNANCDYVEPTEQAEIESLHIAFEDVSGKELTLDEFLQS